MRQSVDLLGWTFKASVALCSAIGPWPGVIDGDDVDSAGPRKRPAVALATDVHLDVHHPIHENHDSDHFVR